MALLNAAFMDQAGGQFATAQIAKVALGSHGTVRLSLCSAGHPPALHRHGSQITSRSSGNPLVGARRRIAYNDTETVLAAGDAVVMYTDGVTEAGRPFDLFEQQRLSRAIIDAGRNSEAVVEAIELAVRSHQVGELKDDIAILCLQALDEQRSAPSVTRAIP
jgi:serine phosphatase RsbU (regulator of sigma subunit)